MDTPYIFKGRSRVNRLPVFTWMFNEDSSESRPNLNEREKGYRLDFLAAFFVEELSYWINDMLTKRNYLAIEKYSPFNDPSYLGR